MIDRLRRITPLFFGFLIFGNYLFFFKVAGFTRKKLAFVVSCVWHFIYANPQAKLAFKPHHGHPCFHNHRIFFEFKWKPLQRTGLCLKLVLSISYGWIPNRHTVGFRLLSWPFFSLYPVQTKVPACWLLLILDITSTIKENICVLREHQWYLLVVLITMLSINLAAYASSSLVSARLWISRLRNHQATLKIATLANLNLVVRL